MEATARAAFATAVMRPAPISAVIADVPTRWSCAVLPFDMRSLAIRLAWCSSTKVAWPMRKTTWHAWYLEGRADATRCAGLSLCQLIGGLDGQTCTTPGRPLDAHAGDDPTKDARTRVAVEQPWRRGHLLLNTTASSTNQYRYLYKQSVLAWGLFRLANTVASASSRETVRHESVASSGTKVTGFRIKRLRMLQDEGLYQPIQPQAPPEFPHVFWGVPKAHLAAALAGREAATAACALI